MQAETFMIFICWIPIVQFTWLSIGYFRPKRSSVRPANNSITLVIPFRNEAENLPALIQHLNKLILEQDDRIFLVDDGSEDGGIPIETFLRNEITCIRLKNEQTGSKKHALSTAILEASTEWILTTDADCAFDPYWLEEMRAQTNSNLHMLIGPVLTKRVSGLPGVLQTYESACLWFVSKASAGWNIPILCSGANLLFRRSSWLDVNGYKTHRHILSGDDVLLMNDFVKRWKNGVQTTKNKYACVLTNGHTSWKHIFDQRKRWSSKTAHLGGAKRKLLATGLMFWLFMPLPAFFFDVRLPATLIVLEISLVWTILHSFSVHFNVLHWLLFRTLYPIFLGMLLFYKPGVLLWKGRPIQ
jgi:biofilm PGA synthesis N-glycosyltransferase PgaC